VRTTAPGLRLASAGVSDGRLTVSGAARRVPIEPAPTATSGSVTDPAGDSVTPVTDITAWKVKVGSTAVDAEMQVSQLWPGEIGSAATAYSILIDGRRLDSFVPNGSTDGKPVVMDNGTGYYLPPGTATWDASTSTVKFHVLREYLADNNIAAPYSVTGVTGIHERNNDWVADDDHAPDKGGINVTGPAMTRVTVDKPVASTVTTKTVTVGTGSFTAAEQDLILTSNPAGGEQALALPIAKQATVTATLTWDDPSSSLALQVDNGSQQKVVKTTPTSMTIEVPWARRDLVAVVSPSMPLGVPQVNYTVKATITTVVADADHDLVPDVADVCAKAAGPRASAGCPDTAATACSTGSTSARGLAWATTVAPWPGARRSWCSSTGSAGRCRRSSRSTAPTGLRCGCRSGAARTRCGSCGTTTARPLRVRRAGSDDRLTAWPT